MALRRRLPRVLQRQAVVLGDSVVAVVAQEAKVVLRLREAELGRCLVVFDTLQEWGWDAVGPGWVRLG